MTKVYEEVVNARLVIGGKDATYAVQFDTEWLKGKTWEFDPMSDCIGQLTHKRTGNMRVRFYPIKESMTFPEDANRRCEYIMSIERARDLWKLLGTRQPNFWYALDISTQRELNY